eukprot:172265-Hanusia_phi.AAC.1
MLELTGGLEYVLPVMAAVMVSKWTGDSLGRRTVYENVIEERGYPFLDNKHEPRKNLGAADKLVGQEKKIRFLSMDSTVRDVRELLGSCTYQGFPVVHSEEDMTVAGYVLRESLEVS